MATYFVSLHSLLQRAQQAEASDPAIITLDCFMETDYTNWPSIRSVEGHHRQSMGEAGKGQANIDDRVVNGQSFAESGR